MPKRNMNKPKKKVSRLARSQTPSQTPDARYATTLDAIHHYRDTNEHKPRIKNARSQSPLTQKTKETKCSSRRLHALRVMEDILWIPLLLGPL